MKRIIISAFLLFHIVAITCWSIPMDSPLIAVFRHVIRPYFLWTGLFQSWDMFAPAPKFVNSYVDAVVSDRNGHTSLWKFPRMEQLSFTERYFEERYRKFVENLKEDKNVAFWPDAARRIARLNSNAANPPEIIMLIRHWSGIVPYGDGVQHTEPWHAQIFYEYKVRPEDLK